MPVLHLHDVSAVKVFESLQYIVQALTYREAVNQLVNYYDQRVTQDQLHMAEFIDIKNIDAERFLNYLQLTRRQRRQFKDLSIILNTLAENMDIEAIINYLLAHPSLHNQYIFRDHQAALTMGKMIKN